MQLADPAFHSLAPNHDYGDGDEENDEDNDDDDDDATTTTDEDDDEDDDESYSCWQTKTTDLEVLAQAGNEGVALGGQLRHLVIERW